MVTKRSGRMGFTFVSTSDICNELRRLPLLVQAGFRTANLTLKGNAGQRRLPWRDAVLGRGRGSVMLILRGFIDRMLLVCAVVAGGLVPGFVAQYRQRLGGRLDQAQLDLAPWRKLADQFYNGDISGVIQYHLASGDPKFRAEGDVIRSLVNTVHQLQSAVDALHGNLFQQAAYLVMHADPGLARATMSDWVPTFALSLDGLLFALVLALGVWLLFHLLWRLVALILPRAPRARAASRRL
jgi:Protein of unknown function (DUF2937)